MKKIFSVVLLSLFSLVLSGCLGNDLPKCDSKEVKLLLSDIITKALKDNGDEFKYISSDNVKEIGFNKEKEFRVCRTDVLYSDGDKVETVYNIYWQDAKKDYFYVEIVN